MNIKKLKKAAQSYGTPLYVYDLSVIDRQLEKLKVAFNKINDYQIHFAAKALSNISILKYLNNLGLGLDAVSIEEVKIGIKCGFKKEEILFEAEKIIKYSHDHKARNIIARNGKKKLFQIFQFN